MSGFSPFASSATIRSHLWRPDHASWNLNHDPELRTEHNTCV
jgi:hypothetical protein